LRAFELTQKTALAISDVFDERLFPFFIQPNHIERADQLASATSITALPINPADSHDASPLKSCVSSDYVTSQWVIVECTINTIFTNESTVSFALDRTDKGVGWS
jgi:hypothetical protein